MVYDKCLIAILLSLLHITSAQDLYVTQYNKQNVRALFLNFTKDYNKSYGNEEELERRYTIFKENLQRINRQNKRYSPAVFGINKFSDLLPEEYENKYLSSISYDRKYNRKSPLRFIQNIATIK